MCHISNVFLLRVWSIASNQGFTAPAKVLPGYDLFYFLEGCQASSTSQSEFLDLHKSNEKSIPSKGGKTFIDNSWESEMRLHLCSTYPVRVVREFKVVCNWRLKVLQRHCLFVFVCVWMCAFLSFVVVWRMA